MVGFVIKDDTLEHALEKASSEFNLPIEELNYNIINNKKGFFKKSIEIEVFPKESVSNKGKVSITEGSFIVENPIDGGTPAEISIPQNLELFVDGKQVKGKIRVLEDNKISYSIEKKQAKRNLDIKISDDSMKVSLWITYEPEITYGIKDSEKNNEINIEIIEKEKVYPPKFSSEDIEKIIEDKKIVFGILKDRIKEIETIEKVEGVIIAEGIPVIDDVEDKIKILFNEDKKSKDEDDLEKVDYKNFYSIANIEANQPLAEIIIGSEGKDGKDVFGIIKKRKVFNRANIKLGEGCYLNDNKVIATIEGRPCVKGGVFYVYKVLNQEKDVDVKSGNIHFIGDVHVKGEVKEGMYVEAGNTLTVEKNIEGATLSSKGEMILKSNIIRGKIIAGGDNTVIMNELSLLKGIREDISQLIEAVVQIKERNIYGSNSRDGEIIIALLEKKFKRLKSKIIILLMETKNQEKSEDSLKILLKRKVFSLGVTEIKSYNELYEIVEKLDVKIEYLSSQVKLPVNLYIDYAQDSNIESSGDIIFTGRGSYLSNISAQGSVCFQGNNSVVRGGLIKAQKEIKCNIVGSEGGGKTLLKTSKEGHIYANVVYSGTKFMFGIREYVLEQPSKSVHSYLDEHGEIVVDKFVL